MNTEIWKAIPYCLMWCIWRQRNARSFEGCEKSVVDPKLSLLKSSFEWMTASGPYSFSNFIEMLDCCNFCA